MAPSPSSTGTVLERIAVADAGSQTTDDMIDVLTAEAIVAEALQVLEMSWQQSRQRQNIMHRSSTAHSQRLRLNSVEPTSALSVRTQRRRLQSGAQRTGRQHGRQPSSEQQMRQLRAKLLRSVLVCAPIV